MPPKRLLDVETLEIILSEDIKMGGDEGKEETDAKDKKIPYAIVSHRWAGPEITFVDFRNKSFEVEQIKDWKENPEKINYDKHPGCAKIAKACQFATQEGIRYVWLDTCCIDKSQDADSKELSEAINLMFRWYQDAQVCYAFLHDVCHEKSGQRPQQDSPKFLCRIGPFDKSDWFKRGWTLQELLAPRNVKLYGHNWELLGTKLDKRSELSAATGIDEKYLRKHPPNGPNPLDKACIAVKMSWLSGRETTVKDDMAYCMLGIFKLSMGRRHGEEERAFMRLQEALVDAYMDESIFAWCIDRETVNAQQYGLLAPWPSCFRQSGKLTIEPENAKLAKERNAHGYTSVRQGIDFELPMDYPDLNEGVGRNNRRASLITTYDLGLNCWLVGHETAGSITIQLKRDSTTKPWRRYNLQSLNFGNHLKESIVRKMFGAVVASTTRAQHIPNVQLPEEGDIARDLADVKPRPPQPLAAPPPQSKKSSGFHFFRKLQGSQYATNH